MKNPAGHGREGAPAGSLTRGELRKRLEELAESPPPKDLAPGAMCYEVCGSLFREEYVCPKCGERTLTFANPETHRAVADEIAACRRMIGQIRGVSLELDESSFCRKCSPDARLPSLGLVVRYPDREEPVRTSGVCEEDLRLLAEFLAGERKHKGSFDQEEPLQRNVERIRCLLGLE